MIPDLTVPGNLEKWGRLEESKRRLYYGCLRLSLPQQGLRFKFVASTSQEAAVTGYADGVITVNVWEADPVTREQTRHNLNEKLRTLIGHFRHEFGHFYWQQVIVSDANTLEQFRQLFGDERQDYQSSLDTYYSNGSFHGPEYISVYASSHPWEDWAETFSHYLHLRDVLETAQQFELWPSRDFEFEQGIDHWIRFSVALNEVNRSMGLPDLYPFTLTPQVVSKLEFVHQTIVGPHPLRASACK